jgi:hypothetical protein
MAWRSIRTKSWPPVNHRRSVEVAECLGGEAGVRVDGVEAAEDPLVHDGSDDRKGAQRIGVERPRQVQHVRQDDHGDDEQGGLRLCASGQGDPRGQLKGKRPPLPARLPV